MKKRLILIISLFVFEANANDITSLGLCRDIDGNLKPIEKLLCESTSAMLEIMNPTLKIPTCDGRGGPQVISGDKTISAVFISCTSQSYNACKNIATSVMKNQPGVTVNILVTSDGIANESIRSTLLELVDASQKKKSPLNILPINSVTDRANIAYMRDPGLFTKNESSKTTYVGLPYSQQGIPGTMIMGEAMKWCSIEQVDTYKSLASFDSAYNALTYDKNSFQNEAVLRELAGINSINDFSTQNSTMGGNLMALPNGTLIAGYTDTSKMNPSVIDYFSKKHKVLQVKLPNLAIGHIDEIINIVPSNGPCGYSILQASPEEAVKYLETEKDKVEPFLGFFDLSLLDKNQDERKSIQSKLHSVLLEKSDYLKNKKEVPINFLNSERKLQRELEVLNGMHDRTPSEIINDKKILAHWRKLEIDSNNVVKEVISELTKDKNSCSPEVIKLPVFWDITMPRPLIPNPVNGLAINGAYFRSSSKGQMQKRDDLSSRRPYPQLEEYIDKKINSIFPKGVHRVDTGELDEGSGNFHCATTNIYLPCKS